MLDLAFMDVTFLSFDFHKSRIKKTLDSYFDGFIESITLSIVNFRIWFLCIGFPMNSEVPFDDLRVDCVFWYMLTLWSQRIFTFMRVMLTKIRSLCGRVKCSYLHENRGLNKIVNFILVKVSEESEA